MFQINVIAASMFFGGFLFGLGCLIRRLSVGQRHYVKRNALKNLYISKQDIILLKASLKDSMTRLMHPLDQRQAQSLIDSLDKLEASYDDTSRNEPLF